MMGEPLFFHEQYGPYQQLAQIKVKDAGNNLPIGICMVTGDPHSATNNTMSVGAAELFYRKLGQAIETAKEAGL